MVWHSSASSPVGGGLQAPVRNGGAVPIGRAVAATPVRNPRAIQGKAAFDQFDRLTAGKAQTRKAMPHGESGGRGFPIPKLKYLSGRLRNFRIIHYKPEVIRGHRASARV